MGLDQSREWISSREFSGSRALDRVTVRELDAGTAGSWMLPMDAAEQHLSSYFFPSYHVYLCSLARKFLEYLFTP